MIPVPLDDTYLEWLYSQVGSVRVKNPSRTYWNLFRILYKKEFFWFVPNDDNRVEDGRNLRYDFIDELGLVDVDPKWMALGCSFLEMLIGLSRRLEFMDGHEAHEWFWHFLKVLELDIYADNIRLPEDEIDDILNTVIWRTYRRDGQGGLFPLKHPREDQTEVEIWYQLSAYLLEHE